jgi:micrococcal nuclease
MRWGRVRVVITLAVSVLAAGCASASERAPPGQDLTVPVTTVTDGDTIHVTYQGRDERVRMIGVDTPEVSWYGGKAECFGEEAGLYTRHRLDGRTIRLEFDVDLRDRYDRLLAYVYVGSELFNLTLVRLGYAAADPVPPDTARATAFGDAERAAKAARRGQWSACPSSIP